jgi:dTDP-4-dehydrorhamnose reductase
MVGRSLAAALAAAADIEVLLTQHSNPGASLYLDAATTPPEAIRSLVGSVAPDYAINCTGILNSRIDPSDCTSLTTAIEVNAKFPHHLALATEGRSTRVIHISTDGVFSGLKKQPYVEADLADATDDYGRTKALGECRRSHVLNVRCSIVGRNPERGRGLLEWLLRVPEGERIDGYVDQMWNGVTNKQLARFCLSVIRNDLFDAVRLEGHLLHFCPNPAISKYELLRLWRDVTGKDVVVQEKEKPITAASRVLASEYNSWRKAVGPVAPWPELLQQCLE